MSILPIRLFGDPALRQTCALAEVDDGLRRLAAAASQSVGVAFMRDPNLAKR